MSRRSRHDSEDDEAFDGPSRTQLKNESEALQDLGVALLELPAAQFDALDLDERLRNALIELRRLGNHRGARKRQAQYVGKLMRNTDVEPLQRALDERRNNAAREVRALKNVEIWRERLLSDDAGALDAWLRQHPQADAPTFRALVAHARREHAARADGSDAAPRYARELFKALREAMVG